MTSDLDAKGPHVHSDEHNPERDNPGTHAASQPGTDPNGIAARLHRLAQGCGSCWMARRARKRC